jgi:hypothetical protein
MVFCLYFAAAGVLDNIIPAGGTAHLHSGVECLRACESKIHPEHNVFSSWIRSPNSFTEVLSKGKCSRQMKLSSKCRLSVGIMGLRRLEKIVTEPNENGRINIFWRIRTGAKSKHLFLREHTRKNQRVSDQIFAVRSLLV